MRELVMLEMLPAEKQKAYKEELAARDRKQAKKRRKQKEEIFEDIYQDDYFFFIAGYTPGGAPYGVTWEEARENGLLEE